MRHSLCVSNEGRADGQGKIRKLKFRRMRANLVAGGIPSVGVT